MSTINMEYQLRCDTCDFNRYVVENGRAYMLAKEHESEYGNHFVLMETIQE